MKATLTRGKRICKVKLGGELTIYHAHELHQKLVQALSSGRDLELSLGEVTELDSAGLQLLLVLRREAEALGRACVVREIADEIAQIAALCGLGATLERAA